MRRFMILSGFAVLMAANIIQGTSEKKNIKPSSKMYNTTITKETDIPNQKASPYNHSFPAGSVNYFLMDVKMPINSVFQQKNDGC
jgi:hypothetical protein